MIKYMEMITAKISENNIIVWCYRLNILCLIDLSWENKRNILIEYAIIPILRIYICIATKKYILIFCI